LTGLDKLKAHQTLAMKVPLGLAISKAYVEILGGKWVKVKKEMAARFILL
jgi:hypothetical protein